MARGRRSALFEREEVRNDRHRSRSLAGPSRQPLAMNVCQGSPKPYVSHVFSLLPRNYTASSQFLYTPHISRFSEVSQALKAHGLFGSERVGSDGLESNPPRAPAAGSDMRKSPPCPPAPGQTARNRPKRCRRPPHGRPTATENEFGLHPGAAPVLAVLAPLLPVLAPRPLVLAPLLHAPLTASYP